MTKCPFCNVELVENDEEVVKVMGERLSTMYNNKLICYIPHVTKFCPKCFFPEVDDKVLNFVLDKKDSFTDILSQEIDCVDKDMLARQAECRAYAYELADDISMASIHYKAALDIMESNLDAFEKEHLQDLKTGEVDGKVLLDEDLEQYSNAKVYCDTMRELVVNTSSKSFEKLGYLGILIYLDTITQTKNFVVADKMFALLNDPTTKIPDVLKDAKEQLEDRYIKIRKQNLKK